MTYKGNRNWTLPKPTLGLNLTQCEVVNNMTNMTFLITSPTTTGSTDGSIKVFVTNAIEPSYSLNGGIGQSNNFFSGLTSGNYSVVVTDLAVPAPNNTISGTTTLSSSNPPIYDVQV